MPTKTTTYAFDMEKLPRELARTETVAGSQGNVERFSPLRALLATHESTRRMLPATAEMEWYNEGFRTAFVLLAEALNISLGIPSAHHYLDR